FLPDVLVRDTSSIKQLPHVGHLTNTSLTPSVAAGGVFFSSMRFATILANLTIWSASNRTVITGPLTPVEGFLFSFVMRVSFLLPLGEWLSICFS
ncbi:hypothetical protein, partial [uncultured Allobaculum sp.]|uniref:hypothetical protein n=1 Tax=uncultured Allobaculum sp. TaxID=1187017 RepID=UPI002632FBFC